MSRTYKDRSWNSVARSAADADVIGHYGFDGRPYGDAIAYARTHGLNHAPVRKWESMRFVFNEDWVCDYGTDRDVHAGLRRAVVAANNGLMDDDWDDADVYRRRRRWRLS